MIDKAFITGCDIYTEWMLPWFINNFRQHNQSKVVICDFGMSDKMRSWSEKHFDLIYDINKFDTVGLKWSYKPLAIIEAPVINKMWIDTDCQVLSPIDDVFKYIRPNKLSMVVDRPWTKKFKRLWFNSGLVGAHMKPEILVSWASNCQKHQTIGDQEVLHAMLQQPLADQIYVEEIPNWYNWLRLQLKHGDDSTKKKVVHWTGKAGKNKIQEMINGS